MMPRVKGRTTLVTGAGSPDGIGFATERLVLAAGANVAITSTTNRILDNLAKLDPGTAARIGVRGEDTVSIE
jgi:3-oxoacyl-[acyl-carrier protein] reductase